MNRKAISNGCTLAHFRILIIVGTVGLLFSLLHAACGEVATNITETSLFPSLSSSANETIVPDTVSTLGILQTPSDFATPDTNADDAMNRVGFIRPTISTTDPLQSILPANVNVENDNLTGFAMVRAASNLTLLPNIEGMTPVYGSKALELKELGAQKLNSPRPWAEASLGWGDSVVQFFAPFSYLSPPGGRQQSDWDESDHPWPVIAGGAASGNTWNEPGLYQAQGFLSICW